jgi:putative endonuclease
MNEKERGAAGEARAARFLSGQGYSIIARNYLSRNGEIDIIAVHEGQLVFIEVKSWKNTGFENLEYAVNRNKRNRIIESSKKYIFENPVYADFSIRYDVILITERENRIYHINNAFSEVE